MTRKRKKFRSMRPDLEADRPLLGYYVTFQIPDIVEMIGADWDWLWIDLQHSPIDLSATVALVRAAEAAGVYSIVRVGRNDSFLIASALDTGASGVMVPMVNTAAEAEAVVTAAKFAPRGTRSYGSRRLVALYGLDYADTANEDTVVFVQIESNEALANAEAIAAVDGIDGLIFSPDDVSRERGLTVVIPRPRNQWAEERQAVAAAARKHGKTVGSMACTPEALENALKWGYRLCVGAEGDMVVLTASAQISEAMRQTTDKTLGQGT